MKVGIVGMPNAGKSSLFRCAHRRRGRGRQLPVHDDRAERRRRPGGRRAARRGRRTPSSRRRSCRTRSSSTTSPASSPARTRARASATSSSPTSARPTRSSTSSGPTRIRTSCIRTGASTRVADIDTIETELIYADLEQAERRLDRVAKTAKSGDRARGRRGGLARATLIEALQAGTPARTVPPPADAPDAMTLLSPLTAKPVLFVANVEEGSDEVPAAIARARRAPPGGRRRGLRPARVRAVRARRRGRGRDARRSRAQRVRSADGRPWRVRAARAWSRSSPPARTSPRSPGTCATGCRCGMPPGMIHSDIQTRLRPRRDRPLVRSSSTPAAMQALVIAARSGSRAATTSSPTAT